MRGQDVLIKLGGEVVAAQTACEVELTAELVDVTPLPGSDDDDGWTHCMAAGRSWGLSNESFLTTSDKVLGAMIDGESAVDVECEFGELGALVGTGVVTGIELNGQTKGYAKMTAKVVGQDWPEVVE